MPLKLTEINISTNHKRIKNPNWRETDHQLVTCKNDRGVDLGSTENQFWFWAQSGTWIPELRISTSLIWRDVLPFFLVCFYPVKWFCVSSLLAVFCSCFSPSTLCWARYSFNTRKPFMELYTSLSRVFGVSSHPLVFKCRTLVEFTYRTYTFQLRSGRALFKQ